MPQKWFIVLRPDCHVSTAEIFSHKDLTRDTPNITVAAFLEQGGRNDCQALVRRLYPPVDEALNWLSQYTSNARMTGTGACVFAAFDSAEEAQHVLAQAPKNLPGFVAQGINRSPLFNLLPVTRSSAGITSPGTSPCGKAAGFVPALRRFESFRPCLFLASL